MQQSAKKATANYKQLRARLIQSGTTLRRFALDRGYKPATVYNAAKGERSGVITTKIHRELEELTNG